MQFQQQAGRIKASGTAYQIFSGKYVIDSLQNTRHGLYYIIGAPKLAAVVWSKRYPHDSGTSSLA